MNKLVNRPIAAVAFQQRLAKRSGKTDSCYHNNAIKVHTTHIKQSIRISQAVRREQSLAGKPTLKIKPLFTENIFSFHCHIIKIYVYIKLVYVTNMNLSESEREKSRLCSNILKTSYLSQIKNRYVYIKTGRPRAEKKLFSQNKGPRKG